jgi:hypothetical protein
LEQLFRAHGIVWCRRAGQKKHSQIIAARRLSAIARLLIVESRERLIRGYYSDQSP